jgi:trehalose 6-phosphate phosphatase
VRYVGQSDHPVDPALLAATYENIRRHPAALTDHTGSEVRILTTPSPLLDRHSALFLDIDGTLLDIAQTPDEVRVPSGLADALRRVGDLLGGAVALVSGRSIREIDRLFAPLRLPAGGKHGAELRLDHGAEPIEVETAHIGSGVRRAVLEIAQAHPDIIVEDKGAAIALHYRRVPQLKDALAQALRAVVTAYDGALCLLPGRMVWEIKGCASTKATAVRRLMQEPRFAGRRPVFVGDDVTDEDGFREVEDRGGLALAVGGEGSTERRIAFADPAAVRRWLAELPEQLRS